MLLNLPGCPGSPTRLIFKFATHPEAWRFRQRTLSYPATVFLSGSKYKRYPDTSANPNRLNRRIGLAEVETDSIIRSATNWLPGSTAEFLWPDRTVADSEPRRPGEAAARSPRLRRENFLLKKNQI